jgi:hypothetical protein
MILELEYLCSLWEKANKQETGEPYCKVSRAIKLIVPEVTYYPKEMAGSLNNDHWAYDVSYAFRDALDIKFEQRMKNKKPYMVWTQGPLINFTKGDWIHSKCGQKSLQVQFSSGMGWDPTILQMYNGIVNFDRFNKKDGSWIKTSSESLDQMEFLEMLIMGDSQAEQLSLI